MNTVYGKLNLLFIFIISFQLVGCKLVKTGKIDNSFEEYTQSIAEDLELSKQVEINKDIEAISKELKKTVNSAPSMKFSRKNRKTNRRTYPSGVYKNEVSEALVWLADVRAEVDKIVEIVRELGKSGHEQVDGQPVLSVKQMFANEISVYYSLTYLRNALIGAASKTTQYLNKMDLEKLDVNETIDEDRKQILNEYLGTLGLIKITENDLKRTLEKMKMLKDAARETLVGDEVVKSLFDELREKEAERVEKINTTITENASAEEAQQIQEQMIAYDEEMRGKTLLYDPNNPDHPLVHILVIASNLTWGLINTLIGLGFVIVRVLLTPFLGMPTIKVSASRMQIYADVCGLGVPYTKMSAGLFELDFCTSYSFASDHEAGHAKQSAVLGPLYFPAAILSYILVMGHGGYIEHWADAWSHGDGHSH